MRRLEGRDAIFLYMETPTNHMHMAFAGVFDPSTIPGGLSEPRQILARLRELLEARLHLFPPFRQRLVEVPFGLHHPVLVEDPGFDLDFHLRRAALPAPGGTRELEEFVGEVAGRPMDRSHPLWEIYVVEGVEGGRWALVAKAHHAIIDGVGGNEIMINLFDLAPEPRDVPPPEESWDPAPLPSDTRLLARAAAANLVNPPRVVRALAGTVGTVGRVVRDQVRGSPDPPIATLGPRTILNQAVSPLRQAAFTDIAFADVKRVKDTFGVKVNDVVLAVCGRALRRFLTAHGMSLHAASWRPCRSRCGRRTTPDWATGWRG
jgi:diacylglycerol O-acyltransferase / wax synthase